MRFRRLDLLAFGQFAQVVLDLPAGEPDIHFVYGPNEAGKSTTRAAFENLLFGIPPTTPHGFLHGPTDMRIGALLEGDTGSLEFIRRKGNKATLLDKDSLALAGAEAALASQLGGAERTLFGRMFCLDHESLRRGGREILDAHDDVGQILFSAGAGVAGLREHMNALHDEADNLWGSRSSARRKYSQAEDRMQAADAAIKANSVTAARWNELRIAYDDALEAYSVLEGDIEQKDAEHRKLGRIRLVFRDVARHAAVAARLAELAGAALLPVDAATRLEKALNDDAHAVTGLNVLNAVIDGMREERSRLNFDETLLGRGDDIEALREQRIHVRKEKSDLPKRRAELAAAEAEILRLQSELGWKIDDVEAIIAKLPARSKLANAHTLANQRGELASAAESALSASHEAEVRAAQVLQDIAELGTQADIAGLVVALASVRDAVDLGSRITTADREARSASASIAALLASMKPEVPAGTNLATMRVPPASAVEYCRDRSRDLSARLRTCLEDIRSAELALDRHRKEYARVEVDEHAVPADELQRLRKHRDAGWSIIRTRHIEGGSVPDRQAELFASGASLADAYRSAVDDADEAADRRFETAEATARLAEIARQISGQEEHLEVLRGLERGHRTDEEKLGREWPELWKDAPFSPASSDDMIVWLATRAQVLQAGERRTAAEFEAAELRSEESQARDLLVGELAKLGMDGAQFATRPLRAAVEVAVELTRNHEAAVAARRKLDETRKSADVDVARKRKLAENAEAEMSGWAEKWKSAVMLLGLDADNAPETVKSQIETIGVMREFGSRIEDLRRERIGKIERDIAAFDAEVVAVAAAVAPGLDTTEAEEVVVELERRLEEADRVRRAASDLDTRIAAETKKIEECGKVRRTAGEAIEQLRNEAGVTSVGELRVSITRSDELRSLQAELAVLSASLAQAGDGKPLGELSEECAGADLDQISARQQSLVEELPGLRSELGKLGEARASARSDFDKVGGAATAAAAAADRQAALSEMRDIVEQYVRVRSAELLLQAAIDRYRREKQGPLLKRAGELFATMTGGSFQSLLVEYDDHDKPQLAGLRADGRSVPFAGMSAGSADQLYLALRVAAVEDHLASSAPLPFVADDLFVQFDDDRAASGFKVLAELARKTQVLVFTHHSHLLEIAAGVLGRDISVVQLSQATARSEVLRPPARPRTASLGAQSASA